MLLPLDAYRVLSPPPMVILSPVRHVFPPPYGNDVTLWPWDSLLLMWTLKEVLK